MVACVVLLLSWYGKVVSESYFHSRKHVDYGHGGLIKYNSELEIVYGLSYYNGDEKKELTYDCDGRILWRLWGKFQEFRPEFDQ